MLSASGLGDLVPVEVTGLAEGTGQRRGPSGRVGLAVSRVLSGETLVEEDGIPLVVSRSLGNGRVWFVAFDLAQPSVAAGDAADRLWDIIAGRAAGAILPEDGAALGEDPWMRPFLAAPAYSFPSLPSVLVFACLYVLAFVLLAAPKPFGAMRAGARAVLLAVVPIAAAAAGYLLFNRVLFDPSRLLADAARLDCVAGDGLAMVTEKVGLLSTSGPRFGITVAQGAGAVSGPSSAALRVEEQGGRETPVDTRGMTVSGFAERRFAGRTSDPCGRDRVPSRCHALRRRRDASSHGSERSRQGDFRRLARPQRDTLPRAGQSLQGRSGP